MQKLQVNEELRVRLERRGLEPEYCRTSYISEGITGYLGKLLENPRQNFGSQYREGGIIAFREVPSCSETGNVSDEKEYAADLTPSGTLLSSDLSDGSLVCEAVHRYHQEPSVTHLDEVLYLLRDSRVLIPGILTSAGPANTVEDDPLGLLGMRFSGGQVKQGSHEEKWQFVPDLLQTADGSTKYFPVFTHEAVLGEYRGGYEIRSVPFTEAVRMAQENGQAAGILVNAFSEAFFTDAKVFAMLLSLPSRIADPDLQEGGSGDDRQEAVNGIIPE